MKLFFYIMTVVLMIYKTKSDTTEICRWQDARNKIIAKLSRNGQKNMNRILLDIQYITGAAIQPLCAYIENKYNNTISRILISFDGLKLQQLQQLLGCGNARSGTPPLRDECQKSKDIDTLVSSFSSLNQKYVNQILTAFNKEFLAAYKIVLSINNLLDGSLILELEKNENPKTLASLLGLYSF